MFPSSAEPESKRASTTLITLKIASLSTETQKFAIHRSRSLPSARSAPQLRKRRRSVSSMRGLLPLALSPSGSSLRSASSFEGAIGDRVDDYFPEVLAQDLELSMEVFAAKKMTAGAPSSALHLEDKGKLRVCRTALSLPYLAASARVQSLGAIEERRSVVSFLNQHELHEDDTSSDLGSTSDSSTSEGMAPPSFRHRESVRTAATSLASTNWKPSLKRFSPAPDGPCESSWIDGDSDDEERDGVNEHSFGSLSPKSLTRTESVLDQGFTGPKRTDLPGHWGYHERVLHRKPHSVSGESPASPSQIRLSSFDMPTRPSSAVGSRQHKAIMLSEPRQVLPPFTATRPISPRPELALPHRTQALRDPVKKPSSLKHLAEPSPAGEGMSSSEGETMLPTGMIIFPQPNHTVSTKPPSPEPASRSVQSWLNSSLQPCPRPFQNDDLTRVLPLPPDAMETLRVSVACFPETMLLSSSLTIETIRTYSKKVRQPSLELVRSHPTRGSPPESPTQTSRRSLWRKVVPYSRTSVGSERRQNHASGESSADPSKRGSVEAPKPWESLKNIFDCCSDYICDALYAHILAYNYISALVARNPVTPQKGGRLQTPKAGDSQQEDIPKKAASLLGLTSTGDVANAGFNRRARGVTPPLETWLKEEMVHSQTTAAANHENMQSDLLRCICRLVATAKLMAETGEEPMLDMEAADVDRLFVRSLCEIVRIAEEFS